MQPATVMDMDTQDVSVRRFDQAASPSPCELEGACLQKGERQRHQASFYDYAADLLTELLPGWDDGLEDDLADTDGTEEPQETSDERLRPVEAPPPPEPASRVAEDAFIVDVSYLACVREAERFLVECEGLSRQDAVVLGLRDHLQSARDRAVRAVHREALRIVRPPGCTA